MVSLTLSIPDKIKEQMNSFSEINWSGFVKKCIKEKVERLAWKEEMLRKLKDEDEFSEWAIKAQRASRKNRLDELKSKGLI